MKIKKGHDGGIYAVFDCEYRAEKWRWLFSKLLKRKIVSFGKLDNAYQIIGGV